MNPIIEWTVYILFSPIFLMVGIIFAWGAYEMFIAPLLEAALNIVFGEYGYRRKGK